MQGTQGPVGVTSISRNALIYLYLSETLIGRYTAELDSPLHFAR